MYALMNIYFADPVPPESNVTDVIVVGSGAAALTAALTVAVAGKTVRIIEKTDVLGGTSAMSGGMTWLPVNHYAERAGLSDSFAEALAYMRAASPKGWQETEDELWKSQIENGPQMLKLVEAHSPLRFSLTQIPDPFEECEGAKSSRILAVEPLSKAILGWWRSRVRRSTLPQRLTFQETVDAKLDRHPILGMLQSLPLLFRRWWSDSMAQGNGLIIGLLKGCLDQGCLIELSTRAMTLKTDDAGVVTGVQVERYGALHTFEARSAVVLATGGFEWDAQMLATYFPSEVDFKSSPSSNEGDGHKMAQAVGAAFAHMDQGNIVIQPPVTYEGELHGLPLRIHAEPDAIIVDRYGRRFASEYEFWVYDRIMDRNEAGELIHQPAWVISHWPMVKRTPLIRWYRRYKRDWLLKASSIEELAERTKLPVQNLKDTVERFNGFARTGRDLDFKRGTSNTYERKLAENLGLMEEIDTPPYVAYRFRPSLLGTKGGVRTNARGQALRADGTVIPGLYCAGNVMASPTGARTPSQVGTTLGPYMTWGFICGQTILQSNR
ncbi:FAD-dependent oxidoreductase [Mesorhizobium sp. AD1-1]|uniref:FAD-dependent oxidoreductase n=1 Tax=Mesorhizobium sp. AD1-1 TaxID=2876621 RepID=UPI001CCD16E4|nr:FAD-dependent oxidoreductase [Mesorhizobium sp. AD1-1]MBZ9719267.1 FAD-dependent oxidoreductase [Mesorhizobium sp. AD1-1]